jgi:hypothetical protein
MVRLIQRQTPRRCGLAPREQFVTADRKRPVDLIARRPLIARDLQVRRAATTAVKQMPTEADADSLP